MKTLANGAGFMCGMQLAARKGSRVTFLNAPHLCVLAFNQTRKNICLIIHIQGNYWFNIIIQHARASINRDGLNKFYGIERRQLRFQWNQMLYYIERWEFWERVVKWKTRVFLRGSYGGPVFLSLHIAWTECVNLILYTLSTFQFLWLLRGCRMSIHIELIWSIVLGLLYRKLILLKRNSQ